LSASFPIEFGIIGDQLPKNLAIGIGISSSMFVAAGSVVAICKEGREV
jgi:hypothetical protein